MYEDTAACYDTVFPFNPRVIELLTGYLTHAPSRILDIGCGTGKYVAALTEDHQPTGIDPDEASIARARLLNPGCDFRCCDLFSFDEEGPFDLVCAIGNVIAHIPPDQIQSFIDRVYGLLRPGGRWISHTLHWEPILTRQTFAFPVITRSGVTFTRHYREITPERVSFDTVLVDASGNSHTNRLPLYPLTQQRIFSLHDHFTPLGRYADYGKTEFTPDSTSQVLIFQR